VSTSGAVLTEGYMVSVCLCRDGLITVSSTDSGQLQAHCQDWTGGLTPLHDMAVAAADSGVAAVAWLDRVAVWAAPWAPAAAAVTATYNCPQVRGAILDVQPVSGG
jgi:hypothetical protein